MRQGHQGYTERRNREWNPRTEPTERERDVLRAIANLPEGVRASTLELCNRLCIGRVTLQRHRSRLVELGLMQTVSGGSNAHMQLTEAGKQCLQAGMAERAA